jgi:hypothetical protein
MIQENHIIHPANPLNPINPAQLFNRLKPVAIHTGKTEFMFSKYTNNFPIQGKA